MTPTMLLGAALLVSICGLVASLFYRGVNSGEKFGELTGAVKSLATNVGEIKDLFKAHGERLDDHEADIQKLKFILDIDGNSRSIVTDVMTIRERLAKKRNSGT
jgi:hypothetical protein